MIAKILKDIETKYAGFERQKNQIEAEIIALQELGVCYGKPSYKNEKYLRLIIGKGENRKFKYIGADQEKIKAALDSIERGRKVICLEDELSEVISRINNMMYYLERAGF